MKEYNIQENQSDRKGVQLWEWTPKIVRSKPKDTDFPSCFLTPAVYFSLV